MSSTDSETEFTTVSVTPDLRDDLRHQRDDLGFASYGSLIEAMKAQYDPEGR